MKNIVFLITMVFCCSLFGQKTDVTNSLLYYEDFLKKQDVNDLYNAREASDQATIKIDKGAVLKSKQLSKYFHSRGSIYLSLFEKTWFDDGVTVDFDFLSIASISFTQDIENEGNNSKESNSKLQRCALLYQDAGYSEYENKNYVSSEDKFARAVGINTTLSINLIDTLNMFYAAVTSFLAEDFDKCINWSNKLIVVNPLEEKYHLRLIASYKEKGDIEGQIEAINNARKSIPNSKNIILEEVNYYISIENNELLLKSLDKAVNSDPENPILHAVLGQTYSSLGDYTKAKLSYERVLEIDPDYVDAHNNIAAIYLEEANTFIEQKDALPLSASSKKYNSLSSKIKTLRLKALPYLEKVLFLQPTDESIIETLKQIYYQLEMDKKSMAMKKLMGLSDEQKVTFVEEFFLKGGGNSPQD